MKVASAISRSALFLGIFAALASALIAWTWNTTKADIEPVSYTHLTLPTILLV